MLIAGWATCVALSCGVLQWAAIAIAVQGPTGRVGNYFHIRFEEHRITDMIN